MVHTTIGGIGRFAWSLDLASGSSDWCWCWCIGMWSEVLLVGVWNRVEVLLRWWCKSGWLSWAESGVARSSWLHHTTLAVLSDHVSLVFHQDGGVGQSFHAWKLHGNEQTLQLIS